MCPIRVNIKNVSLSYNMLKLAKYEALKRRMKVDNGDNLRARHRSNLPIHFFVVQAWRTPQLDLQTPALN